MIDNETTSTIKKIFINIESIMRNFYFTSFLLLFSLSSFSQQMHKSPHGGILSPVVIEEDHSKLKKKHAEAGESSAQEAHHNAPLYMAELVFEKSLELHLYFYDNSMKPLLFSKLPEKIKARARLKNDLSRGIEMDFRKENSFYKATLPEVNGKSYEVEIELNYLSRPLHVEFQKF